MNSEHNVDPGFHKMFEFSHFERQEREILKRLSIEWYITNSGKKFRLGATAIYRYFLMKPTKIFSEMFNISRELICVFSPYENFEPRTLDAFDYVSSEFSPLRLENVCRVLISRDPKIEEKITSLLKTDPEQPIVIPFSYDELSQPYDDFFVRNRFRAHFYTRNLFGFLNPLKKDLYFFGRSELIQDIVNRHRSGEHSALFGLRKSGKTSIIYAIERFMATQGEHVVSIDCESPSVHMLRWNELLYTIVKMYKKKVGATSRLSKEENYTEKKATEAFERDMLRIYKKVEQPTLFVFDEIERISPKTGSSPHWRDGDDFVYFWQALRFFFQKHSNVMTYMLVGTNPFSVETPKFGVHDNPLFSSIPFQYVPNFDFEKTRNMVRKLGKYMGIKFDEIVYAKLADDFGGHPFLIRQVCSIIHREAKGDRPVVVDKTLYERAKQAFLLEAKHYIEMVIEVLEDWYNDEYDMLMFLANEDVSVFNDFARDNNYYTNHLVGYGVIKKSQSGGYSFQIESIKDYLANKHRYEKRNKTSQQKILELTERRVARGCKISCVNGLS